jgi:hypothetical protein
MLETMGVSSTRLREQALAALAALAGMILLPALCLTLRNIGPASRVVFYEYLPVEELAITCTAAGLGATLGAQASRWFRPSQLKASRHRWPIVRMIALGLLLGFIALAQLRAFPASSSIADRSAWARAHVPRYVALTRVVAAVPEVQRDIGRIFAIAPTAFGKHRSAREMNGDDMFFSLDVVGERGSGVFYVDCTLDDSRVYDWRSGRWVIHGREERITSVSDRVPHAGAARATRSESAACRSSSSNLTRFGALEPLLKPGAHAPNLSFSAHFVVANAVRGARWL